MDDHASTLMSAQQTAETLRRIADRAFQRRLDVDSWPGVYLEHAARVYELAAVMVEDAVGEDDARRVLEALRLHEAGAEAFLLRWLYMTVADFIAATLLGDAGSPVGIPPAGTRP